jgi:oligopeptide transport system substrate-binding protein
MRARRIRVGVILLLAAGAVWLVAPRADSAGKSRRAAENTLHTILLDRTGSLDPVSANGQGPQGIVRNIYETLYQYHYLARPYIVVPCLAASMPETTDEGRVVRITLRDDLRFQDDPCFPDGRGRAVTASDVIYSWKRLADPHNASPHWSVLKDRIEGLDAFRATAKDQPSASVDYTRNVEGLVAESEHILRVTLTHPWHQFVFALTALPTAVVAREAVEKYGPDFPRHPVGTGPYRVELWRDNIDIALVRNPNFRKETYPSEGAPDDLQAGLLADAGKPLPFIDRLEFRFCKADSSTWLMLMQGDLDAHGVSAGNFSEVMSANGALSDAMRAKGLQLDVFPSAHSRWIGLNLAVPLMRDNRPLRQAISLAFDREEFNQLILNGRNRMPTSLIPPCLKEHNPDATHPLLAFDVPRARKLKQQADALNGAPIRSLRMLLGGSSPVMRQIGQMFKQWLARIDIDLELEMVEEGRLHQRMLENPPHLFFATGFTAKSPDASAVFQSFYGPNDATGDNPTHYHNPDFDRLFEKASTLPDTPERLALYRQMDRMVLDDMPCVPFTEYTWLYVRHDWLKNFKAHAFFGPLGAPKYQRIDYEARALYVEGHAGQ